VLQSAHDQRNRFLTRNSEMGSRVGSEDGNAAATID
jgi:hypothetical protein